MNLHGTGPAQGFWALLSDDERTALSGLGRPAVYSPGTVMFVEGDPSTHVFVLVEGWVKIVGVTSDGHELTLALRGRGDTVGEMAAETTGYRTATVRGPSPAGGSPTASGGSGRCSCGTDRGGEPPRLREDERVVVLIQKF